MNAALRDFQSVNFSTAKSSMYESLLVGFWLRKKQGAAPTIDDVNDAVDFLCGVLPDHELGRFRPCRFGWAVAEDSGRKTVWNNTTRGPKLATSIFVDDDIRNGLRSDAIDIALRALDGERLPSLDALAVLVTRSTTYVQGATWEDAWLELADALGIEIPQLGRITTDRPLNAPLIGDAEWEPSTIPADLRPPETVTVQAPKTTSTVGTVDEVVLDPRIERMLLTAVRKSQCVVLVGPPGSGKGTLVRWLVEQATSDPTVCGLSQGYDPNPMWKTPDESWSAFDLIGGFVPTSDGDLVWSEGLLQHAIGDDRWLVLDETNRADMDKIMGPVMTWLSKQEVEIGRTEPVSGLPIHIGWTDTAASEVERPTTYRAGSNWRFLGTYNPLDAHRVFRMGQALSRRFVVVPIPALAPGLFEQLIAKRLPSLDTGLASAVSGLYAAHYSHPDTLLGPAVFLRMAEFVVEGASREELAESYVSNVGKFVASFDDATFEALGTRVVEDEDAMEKGQWQWVKEQRAVLG